MITSVDIRMEDGGGVGGGGLVGWGVSDNDRNQKKNIKLKGVLFKFKQHDNQLINFSF